MKKIIMLAVITLSFFVVLGSASAITEQQLRDKIAKVYKINGANFQISEDDLVLVDRYLDQYDLSEADMNYISYRIDDAVNIIKNSGKTSIKDLPKADKEELKKLVEKVSANTDIDATVVGTNLVVYKPGTSKEFAVVTDLVKQTGENDNTMLIAVGISTIVLLASGYVALRKLRLSKNA